MSSLRTGSRGGFRRSSNVMASLFGWVLKPPGRDFWLKQTAQVVVALKGVHAL